MIVRDAVEDDAPSMAAIADAPRDVMRNIIHDRTVSVAELGAVADDPNEDTADAEPDILGFVSFDVRDGVVHVTQIGGTEDACKQLLAEPLRFARAESMPVELLVPDDDPSIHHAAGEVGLTERGPGPTILGTPTTRYRLE